MVFPEVMKALSFCMIYLPSNFRLSIPCGITFKTSIAFIHF
ncbi:hypothetical protein pah_c013o063 [Parachlamydia acanthamoebae str. Hall's coccus]|nr:hypothetical protein pah_c013o063 [Parachlamydia acanthamoebae str. Hall's coccus]